MNADSTGRDLFIVDNSVSGWTGLRYLEEWTGIARAFDIATGYFEIGALLALDGKWQGLEKIRVLMGAETTHSTRRVLLDSVRTRAKEELDQSIESTKRTTPSCAACQPFSRDCAAVRSNAACTTRASFMPRPTSPTPNSKSSVRRRWWGPATSRGRDSRRISNSTCRSRVRVRWPSSRIGSRRIGTKPKR